MKPLDMVENLRARPGMFGLDGTFPMYTAFLRGYEHSHDAGWLQGFRDWLAGRCGDGFNLGWESLVIRLTFPEDPSEWKLFKTRNSRSDELLVNGLFELLLEYLDSRGV